MLNVIKKHFSTAKVFNYKEVVNATERLLKEKELDWVLLGYPTHDYFILTNTSTQRFNQLEVEVRVTPHALFVIITDEVNGKSEEAIIVYKSMDKVMKKIEEFITIANLMRVGNYE